MSLHGYKKKTKPALWKQLDNIKAAFPNGYEPTKPAKMKRINPVSKKRALQIAEYRKLKREIMASNPDCGLCVWLDAFTFNPIQKATELHHICGRVGELLCYKPYIVPVCRDCHEKIHNNPQWAISFGWLGEAGLWNNQSIIKEQTK